MIYLKQNTLNRAIYTPREFGLIDAAGYVIELEHQQTLKTYTYDIIDVSTNTERYSQSDIYIGNTITDWTIDEDYTITSDNIIIAQNNIEVMSGKTLTNNGILLVIGGTVSGSYTGASGSTLNTNLVIINNEVTGHSLTDTSVFVDLQTGYYDYKIIDFTDQTTVLEIGRLLIQDNIQITTIYTAPDDVAVYNPK